VKRIYQDRVKRSNVRSLTVQVKNTLALPGLAKTVAESLQRANAVFSHVPFQLGYRPKSRRPRFLVGASEIESELGNFRLRLANNQTNPEGRARLTRSLIMDLVRIVIFVVQIARSAAVILHPWMFSSAIRSVRQMLRYDLTFT